jgi:hypothetical protein
MDESTRCAADMATPAPKDMSHYYSDVSMARKPSSMKAFYKYFAIPGIANFAGGTYEPKPAC